MSMTEKLLLKPDRVRRIPGRFSWLDQRLVREGHLRNITADASTLYLFLVTVANAKGMSWYSPRRICSELAFDAQKLQKACAELVNADLIAYDDGLYQVLSLPLPPAPDAATPVASQDQRCRQYASAEQINATLDQLRQQWGVPTNRK